MKNIHLVFGVSLALFLFACKNENKQLARKIETDLTTFQPSVDTIVSGHKQIGVVVKAMENADENLKKTEAYTQLYRQTFGMRMKYTNAMNEYIGKIDSLKKLNTDIAAGQVADTTAQQKYTLYGSDLAVYKATFGQLLLRQNDLDAQFKQLQEKFAADPKAYPLSTEQVAPGAPTPQQNAARERARQELLLATPPRKQ